MARKMLELRAVNKEKEVDAKEVDAKKGIPTRRTRRGRAARTYS
jgi:hypothetical protein